MHAGNESCRVGAGGVAVQDLQCKHPDGFDGSEDSLSPAIVIDSAGMMNVAGLKKVAKIGFEIVDGTLGVAMMGHP